MKLELASIHWKAITVFPEDKLVVLECENYQQAFNFISLLLANDFSFKIGEAENNVPAYVITFEKEHLTKHLIAEEDKLFKYFKDKQVDWLTTGFNTETGDVACLVEDKIDIRGFDYCELN